MQIAMVAVPVAIVAPLGLVAAACGALIAGKTSETLAGEIDGMAGRFLIAMQTAKAHGANANGSCGSNVIENTSGATPTNATRPSLGLRKQTS